MTATRSDRGSTETTTIYSEGGDLVFERTFDAPREQVWKAFTDPDVVPRWWGPHGTTTTVAEMDVRPGGRWRYVSSAPDRDDVAFYGEYLEITPPAGARQVRFECHQEGDAGRGHSLRLGARRTGRRPASHCARGLHERSISWRRIEPYPSALRCPQASEQVGGPATMRGRRSGR